MTPPIAKTGSDLIIPNPSTMKLRPNPSMMPRTTGFVVTFSIQVIAPVIPMRNQKRPVKIPDPQIIPGVIDPAWAMTIAPIAQTIAENAKCKYVQVINFPRVGNTQTLEDIFEYNSKELLKFFKTILTPHHPPSS